jgi:hypothetical protein
MVDFRTQFSGTLLLAAILGAPALSVAEESSASADLSAFRKSYLSAREKEHLEKNFGTRNNVEADGTFIHYGGKDYYGEFKTSYTYHFFGRVLHSLRIGGGGLIGHLPEQDATREQVRFYYGEAAVEIEPHAVFALSTGARLGVNDNGVGGGWFAEFRIGPAYGVNFQFGGQLMTYVGHRAFLAMEIPVVERFRLKPQIMIENAPRRRDLGFRLALRGDYRASKHVGLYAEAGAAARDVERIGASGALGLNFYF